MLHFSRKAVCVGAALLCVAPVLAACGEKTPEATDAQLLDLLGSRSTFIRSDAPLRISRSTVECVRLIANLDEDILKDMPAEMLGVMKTECRRELDNRLKDEAANPMGFQLAHFENSELAERITQLKESTDEANRQAEQERRQREEDEARASAERELEDLRTQYAAFVASIDERLSAARPLCDDWLSTQEALKQKDNWTNWAYRQSSSICTDDVEQIRAQAAQHLDALNSAEVSGSGTFYNFPKPYFGYASAEWFDEQSAKLNDDIAQMRSQLSQ